MQQIVDGINGWVWSPALVYLCLLVGLYFSIRTRFMQVRHMGEMVRAMFRGKSSAAGVSSFQALSIALSGRVGTGNIALSQNSTFTLDNPGTISVSCLKTGNGAVSTFQRWFTAMKVNSIN